MIVEKTNYGLKVTIPETYHNSEFTYHLRMVKVLNKDLRWHPAIEELSKREEKLIRQFLLRAYSMENVFKQIPKVHGTNRYFDIWDDHNNMDFNVYYHDGLSELNEMIDAISFQYYDICTEGWPNHKYSCCI